ncbi:MAG: twin-arginine translocation signal domain-containing protein, partial [Candidatus Neomarinimicrobiota bacterium]
MASIKEYKLAMRPKKYLTRDFVVYQDPSYTSVVQGYGSLDTPPEGVEASIEQREGFYKAGLATSGPNKGKWTIKDVWDPAAKKKGTRVFKTEDAANKFIEQLKYKSDKFYKSRVILDDPKKKKAFLKYANKPGVTTADIRNKFDISKEEFFNGGLRDIIDKDFASQRKIQPKTVENMLKLHNDEEAMNYIRKGKIVPDEIITKLNIKPYAAATATVRLAQHYGGQDFGYDELNEVRRNNSASQKLFTAMDKFAFGNPYHSNLYSISLELIDDKLGNERGTFAQLKTKARDVLAKNKIKGFDINEIAGVVGSAKSDAAEFSQFIDVMESKLNQEEMASFQSAFSRARENLKNNPQNFNTISKKINKLATDFEGRYNVQLPRIRKAEDVTKYYSPKRLAELKKQGLDIKGASKRAGYTVQMPKGAQTIQEFINQTSSKDLTNIISTLASGCRVNYADGGRINYSTGSDCYNRGLEVLKQASKGDQTGLQKVKASLKQVGKAGGKVLRFLEIPLEVAVEGLLVGHDMAFNGKPFDEAVKDSGLLLRAAFSDFDTSAEEDRANQIAEANPDAAKYIEAKRALDKYNDLKNNINTFKDDLASADNYQAAVKKFEDYEKKIEDKIPQYTAILTPGSAEYEAFKTDRTGLAKERVDKVYTRSQEMSEMDPIEGAVDEQGILEAKSKKLESNINEIGSTYDWKPTLDEYKKNVIPNIYKATGKVLGENAEFDAFIEKFATDQYTKDLNLFSRPGFAGGGLTRRGFLKMVGALTALAAAAKTGVMKLTTPAAKQVLKNAPEGTPDWFAPLVEKIMKEGVD